MHELYANAWSYATPKTGLICEIALITQSIRDINENIKEVIQETYQTIKNTKVGSDKSYICHIFQRGSTSKVDFIRTLPPRFYDKKYFSLYKSHSQQVAGHAAASEKNPDSRSSILKGAFFKWGLPLSLICCAFGVFFLWRFFHPKPAPDADVAKAVLTASVPAAIPVPPVPEVNAVWRVSGYAVDGSTLTIFTVNSSGAVRPLVNPPNYKFIGHSVSVLLPEGGFATSWTSFDKGAKL